MLALLATGACKPKTAPEAANTAAAVASPTDPNAALTDDELRTFSGWWCEECRFNQRRVEEGQAVLNDPAALAAFVRESAKLAAPFQARRSASPRYTLFVTLLAEVAKPSGPGAWIIANEPNVTQDTPFVASMVERRRDIVERLNACDGH
jgi:hypothetical protein